MHKGVWWWMGVALLSGCASGGKGGTDAMVQVQEDRAQSRKTVAFAPQPMDCARQALCPTLGVNWSNATPNRAVLLIGTVGGQAKVESIEFIARPHAPLRVRTLDSRTSTPQGVTAFLVPMQTLERVAFGKTAWVRVTTDQGVLEENLSTGEGSSLAADALKRLMAEAYQGTDKEISFGLKEMFGKPYEPNYGK